MDNPKTEFTLTIDLMQGEPVKFKVALDLNEVRNMGTALESGLQAKYVGVELHGKLTLIPSHNIRTIEIDPAPPALVAHVVRDARPVDDGA